LRAGRGWVVGWWGVVCRGGSCAAAGRRAGGGGGGGGVQSEMGAGPNGDRGVGSDEGGTVF